MGHPPSVSFPASSSMVVPGLPTTLLPLVGPGRTATIQGFLKATPLDEAVTMSLRITLVASKFNLLTEAVTTSTYHLSPSAWLDGMRGPVSLTTGPVVGTIWATAPVGLVAWPVGKSFGTSTSGLVERTVASLSRWSVCRAGGVCPTSTVVGKAMGLIGGVSSSGREGVVSCAPQGFSRVWLHVSDIELGLAGWWGALGGLPGPCPQSPGQLSPGSGRHVPLIEGDVPPHLLHQLHNAHCQRVVIWVDWQSNFLCPILLCTGHKPQSAAGAAVRCPDRMDHWGENYPWWDIWGQGAWCTLGLGRPHI